MLCDAIGEVDVEDPQLREAIPDENEATRGTNTAAIGKVLKVARYSLTASLYGNGRLAVPRPLLERLPWPDAYGTH